METEKVSNEELVAQIRAGDRGKLLQLWNQVERFVARQASRTAFVSGYVGAEFEDLYQSGYLALLSAVETYDPARGMAFIGWLSVALKTSFAEAGGYRTPRQANDPLRCAASLDAPIGDQPDSDALEALIADDAAEDAFTEADERVYRQQLHDALEKAMNDLTPRQYDILRRRYYGGQSQPDIAAALGCTRSGVSEQERAALKRLYEARDSNGLSEFLENHTNYYQPVGPGTFRRTGTSAVEKIVLKREELAQKWLKVHGMLKGGGKS